MCVLSHKGLNLTSGHIISWIRLHYGHNLFAQIDDNKVGASFVAVDGFEFSPPQFLPHNSDQLLPCMACYQQISDQEYYAVV